MTNHALTEEQKILIIDLLHLTMDEFREEFKRMHLEGNYTGANDYLLATYEIKDIIYIIDTLLPKGAQND